MITNRLEGRYVCHSESQELYRKNGAAIKLYLKHHIIVISIIASRLISMIINIPLGGYIYDMICRDYMA